MNLTEFSVRQRAFTLVFTLALVALGWHAFQSIPRAEDPELDIPVIRVIVVQPGASPTDLERLVARPLEDAIKELEDLNKLYTTVRDGVVTVIAEFTYGTDPDRKEDDVLRQVNAKRADLPDGITLFEVIKVQTHNVAMLQLALVSETASYARLQDLADRLTRRLETVPGVRRAERHAYPEKQVRVTLDLDRLAELRLAPGRLIQALQGGNQVLPAGGVEQGDRRFSLKTTGAYTDLEQVRQTPVLRQGDAVVRLGDVADVAWDYEELEVFGRYNGERAVFVTALPQRGENVFSLSRGLRAAVEAFRPQLPGDVRLEVGFDQSENVEHRLSRLGHDFLIALALVLVTVLPLGLRASLLVMVSVPLSLAIGVALLFYSGYSLNQLSIVGCVIALGLLVDDSIVVVENIARFRREGRPAVDAAIAATKQISVAVVGTTATLLFAFLPLLMLPGGAGQFIRSLPLAVVYTVLGSLLVSLTVVPYLASRFLTGRENPEGNLLLRGMQRGIHAAYRPLLHRCMSRPKTTVAVAAALFALSLLLIPRIGFSLFPDAGIPQFSIRIYGAEGNSVALTDRLAREVEAVLADTPEVAAWFTTVGKGNPQVYYNEFPDQQSASTAEIFARLHAFDPRRSPAVLQRLRERLAGIAGARILLKEYANGPPIEAPIAVRILGDDLDRLSSLAAAVETVLRETPGTDSVDNPLRMPRTDLRVAFDQGAAGLLGVAEAEVDQLARLAVAGLNAARFREADGDEYNITLSLPRGERASLAHWDALRVPAEDGAYVPVAQVASLRFEQAPPLIQRYNRERQVTVTCHVQDGFITDNVTRDIAGRLAALDWPPGYRHEFGGEVESRNESFGGLGTAILLATFGILMILVLEFRSFRGTLVVASVIPLGVIGGLAGLWLSGYTLSFTASIGFIALIGIEIKNSILLVDFTNQLRAEGRPLREAIEQAGEIRFLPVVLTTLTALGALFPLAIQGSAMYSPLAIVIMGGLVSSLLLSRIVTPVLYALLMRPTETPV
jgi:multidrug efflux pump subunit AcrB